jgi:hydrogenase expression/formation protein HypD
MSGHKVMPPALEALAGAPDCRIDGFILPGHVSTIIGTEPYEFLPREHGLAGCIAGFEPTDVLRAVLSLCRQVADDAPEVDNAYRRAVKPGGNPTAWSHVRRIFRPVAARWRGVGVLEGSGLAVRDEWAGHAVEPPDVSENPNPEPECRCGEVLRGAIRPPRCPLFGTACTPDSAVGPCMVSSEGSCAAHYKYGTGDQIE